MLMPSYKLVTHCICRTDLRPSLEDSRRKIGREEAVGGSHQDVGGQ